MNSFRDPNDESFDQSHEDWVPPDEESTKAPWEKHHTEPSDETRTIYTEDRSSDTKEELPEPRRRPVIVILEGKGSGSLSVFNKENIMVGRDVDSDIVLRDGRVSRQHSRILWTNAGCDREEPKCTIEDLGSRNGTIVNGKQVEKVALNDGDRVFLGGTLLGFYIKDEQELHIDQKLLTMATTDSLTGLANRLFFDTEARREIDRARRYRRPLSLMIIDVDHFKNVNDTYGHAAGDTVLRQLARLFLVTIREGDVVGRLGGEEFAILLPETDLEGAVITAERLRTRVEKHDFCVRDQVLPVTVSIGAVEFSSRFPDRASFFEEADRAMYAAKMSGRNRVRTSGAVNANLNPDTESLKKLQKLKDLDKKK